MRWKTSCAHVTRSSQKQEIWCFGAESQLDREVVNFDIFMLLRTSSARLAPYNETLNSTESNTVATPHSGRLR